MPYKRDAKAIQSVLKELPDQSVVTSQPLVIQVPARFEECGLAQVGIDTYVYAMFAMMTQDKVYCVSNACTMLKITPRRTSTIRINEIPYLEFGFDAGDTVIENVNAMRREALIYKVLDEIFFLGKVPWYIGYIDLCKIFSTAKSHAGSRAGDVPQIIEMLASLISRSEQDRTKYFRSILQKQEDIYNLKPSYIPLKSVFYAATNTVSKLAGNYFSDGVVSALVSPAQQKERLETLLRA